MCDISDCLQRFFKASMILVLYFMFLYFFIEIPPWNMSTKKYCRTDNLAGKAVNNIILTVNEIAPLKPIISRYCNSKTCLENGIHPFYFQAFLNSALSVSALLFSALSFSSVGFQCWFQQCWFQKCWFRC